MLLHSCSEDYKYIPKLMPLLLNVQLCQLTAVIKQTHKECFNCLQNDSYMIRIMGTGLCTECHIIFIGQFTSLRASLKTGCAKTDPKRCSTKTATVLPRYTWTATPEVNCSFPFSAIAPGGSWTALNAHVTWTLTMLQTLITLPIFSSVNITF